MEGIRAYTRAQVADFVQAIGRAERRHRLQQLADLRAAGADKKGFRQHVSEIEKQ